MRRMLAGALWLALLAAACSSAPPATPPPATPAPSVWDPRRDAIEQHAGIWQNHQPVSYAYDLDHQAQAGDAKSYAYHVSGLEGGTQVLHLSGPTLQDAQLGDVTVNGLFQRATDALASPAFQIAFDSRAGYPTKLTFADDADASGGAAVESVDAFRTAANPGEVGRAQAALGKLLQRWHGVDDPRWAYTWSRIPAGGAQPITWTVTHQNGKTTAKPGDGGSGGLTKDDVSPDGTVAGIQSVLVSGGWADVAVEQAPGFDILIAVDPQPGARGDAYWIRIAWADLAKQADVSDLQAAQARWATSQLTDYSYTWDYKGDGTPLTYKVAQKGGTATITPVGTTPAPGSPAYATPKVEDTFAMIQAVLDQGGTVDATYDGQLGYPTRVVMHPAGDAGANGVITIKSFKHR